MERDNSIMLENHKNIIIFCQKNSYVQSITKNELRLKSRKYLYLFDIFKFMYFL